MQNMARRVHLHALLPGLGALVLSISGCGRSGEDGYSGPYRHVVVISLDTFRADHIGAYGAQRPTPSMDALCQEGVVFTAAQAPATTTLASHTSMMTGTWPHTHGVPRNGFVLSDQNVTLAEVLGGSGFHTAAVLGSFALESRFHFNQGFDHFDEEFELLVTSGNDQNQKLAETVTDKALEHLDQVTDEERVFLFLHYFDTHSNYAPPPKYAEAVTGNRELTSDMRHVEQAVRERQAKMLGIPVSESPGHSGVIIGGLAGPHRALITRPTGEPSQFDRTLAALYAGEALYVDDQIGRLLSGLEERGLLDEAIVVITGDHGETFWEHGDLWNHGLWVYQTTAHVPFVLRLPDGRFAGEEVAAAVSTVDLLPTLCDLLGLEQPDRVDGRSLVPLASGETQDRGPVFSEATQPWQVRGQGWENSAKPRSVRWGNWKYVRSPYNKIEELFDLEEDPGERTNLLAAGEEGLTPEAARELELLRGALDDWSAQADPLPSEFDRTQTEETREMLKGMGYAGDDEGD